MNYQYTKPIYYNQFNKNNDERIIGAGFLGPFVLGGLTGAVVAPYFYNRPYYYQPYPYYYGPRW